MLNFNVFFDRIRKANGAGDRTRTGDEQLGKLPFYH